MLTFIYIFNKNMKYKFINFSNTTNEFFLKKLVPEIFFSRINLKNKGRKKKIYK